MGTHGLPRLATRCVEYTRTATHSLHSVTLLMDGLSRVSHTLCCFPTSSPLRRADTPSFCSWTGSAASLIAFATFQHRLLSDRFKQGKVICPHHAPTQLIQPLGSKLLDMPRQLSSMECPLSAYTLDGDATINHVPHSATFDLSITQICERCRPRAHCN